MQDDAKVLLNSFWIWPIAVGVLGTSATGLWIGFQDMVWPVSLFAQILGSFLFVAGLSSLVSAVLLLSKALPFRRWTTTSSGQLAFISGGAVAGLYIDLTIMAYSFRYEVGKTWLFGVLALDCACLAWRTLPTAWKHLSKSAKGIGITLAGLGAVANFWFQGFYLPRIPT